MTNIVDIVKHITDLGFQTSVLEDNAEGYSVIELAVSKVDCVFVFLMINI